MPLSLLFRLSVATLLFSGSVGAAPITEFSDPRQIMASFGSEPKLRVLNVWATWCIPCVAEMKDLRRVDEHFRDTDVQLLGVTLDDVIPGRRSASKGKVDKFLQQRRVRYKNLYYTGKMSHLQDFLRFEGEIPITLVYDRQGRELSRTQGVVDRQTLTRTLESLLQKRQR